MRGDWLVLGTIGALAVAGASRRGAANGQKVDLKVVRRAKEAIQQAWRDLLISAGDMSENENVEDVYFDPTDYNPVHFERALTAHSGLKVLGIGGSRAVFDLKDGRVLKLPLASVYDEVSRSEIENWKDSSKTPRVRHMYLPLLQHGEIEGVPYEIFPKVEILKIEDTGEFPQQAERLSSEGLAYDDNRGNFGRYKGRVVLVDYSSEM